MQQDQSKESETSLAPEELRIADRDIKWIAELTEITHSLGGTLVVMGGYAVEALTGGKITRPHDDVDLEFYLPQDCDLDKLSEAYMEAINPNHSDQWKKTLLPDKNFLEYRNDSGSKLQKIEGYTFKLSPNPPSEYPDRLAVRVRKSNGMEYEMPLESVVLIDSEGKPHQVYTQALNEFTALKMQRLMSQEVKPESRQFKASDHDDLKKLVTMPEFSKTEAIEMLTGTLAEEEETNLEEARQQALSIVSQSLKDLGL